MPPSHPPGFSAILARFMKTGIGRIELAGLAKAGEIIKPGVIYWSSTLIRPGFDEEASTVTVAD